MAASFALAAAAAATFNLTCSGTMSSKSLYQEKSEPYTALYRIDLEKRKYCEEACKALFDIADVQPTSIQLQSKEVDSPSERSLLSNSIDRETGKHKIVSTYRGRGGASSIIILKYDGMCSSGPFTGFPKFETKF